MGAKWGAIIGRRQPTLSIFKRSILQFSIHEATVDDIERY